MMVERQPIRHLPKIEPGKERGNAPLLETYTYLRSLGMCSGQPIPDSGLSFSSATAGGNPSLN